MALRPEIGLLIEGRHREPDGHLSEGQTCSATLTDFSNIVLTAAHCVRFWDQDPSRYQFQMSTDSAAISPSDPGMTTHQVTAIIILGPNAGRYVTDAEIDQWAANNIVGAGRGNNDLAVLKIDRAPPVDNSWQPARTATVYPASGSTVTTFGYGNVDRTGQTGLGTKRWASWTYAEPVFYCQSCGGTQRGSNVVNSGDSGGPAVFGAMGDRGQIWGVNSISGNGTGDRYADVVAMHDKIVEAEATFDNVSRFRSRTDFDGDSLADLLWHDGVNGTTQMWDMNGTWRSGVADLQGLDVPDSTGWYPAGVADFSDDGNPDLLWHNGTTGETQVWYMANGVRLGFKYLAPALNVTDASGWRIVGVGSFSTGSLVDILWHNGNTGESQIWFMNYNTRSRVTSRWKVENLPSNWNLADGSGWRPVGVNDFNYDGRSDILWHNGATGETSVWFMDGSSPIGGAELPSSLDVSDATGWRLVGTEDLNWDGSADLLWLHGDTGMVGVWYMNGFSLISMDALPSWENVPAASGWRLVNH
ncbi:MAG TPA: trypsin-like serine protease [Polyangia bacterium]|nr:trypsin-like serine protease [Polyangia bacterium]